MTSTKWLEVDIFCGVGAQAVVSDTANGKTSSRCGGVGGKETRNKSLVEIIIGINETDKITGSFGKTKIAGGGLPLIFLIIIVETWV